MPASPPDLKLQEAGDNAYGGAVVLGRCSENSYWKDDN